MGKNFLHQVDTEKLAAGEEKRYQADISRGVDFRPDQKKSLFCYLSNFYLIETTQLIEQLIEESID